MSDALNYMDTKTAARIWGLSPGTIKNYCAMGKVKAEKLGGHWLLEADQPNPAQPNHPKNWRGKEI